LTTGLSAQHLCKFPVVKFCTHFGQKLACQVNSVSNAFKLHSTKATNCTSKLSIIKKSAANLPISAVDPGSSRDVGKSPGRINWNYLNTLKQLIHFQLHFVKFGTLTQNLSGSTPKFADISIKILLCGLHPVSSKSLAWKSTTYQTLK